MKLYVVFDRVFDDEHVDLVGLGAARAAVFDEEQAHEMVRRLTLAAWRRTPLPPAWARALCWAVEHAGFGSDVDAVVADDDLLWLVLNDESFGDLAVAAVVVVDVDALPRARADRAQAVQRLALLLHPWAPDAAAALAEDA